MKIIKTGKGTDLPVLKAGEHIFVDMWGNWALYKSEYSLIKNRFSAFIEYRQRDMSHFNDNYIRMYNSKR